MKRKRRWKGKCALLYGDGCFRVDTGVGEDGFRKLKPGNRWLIGFA